MLIFFQGIKIAKNCNDPFGVFLSVGIVSNFILYGFVNAAVVTGLLPVTGLPMPMVSYGGSGMIINMSLIGVLLNISQGKKIIGEITVVIRGINKTKKTDLDESLIKKELYALINAGLSLPAASKYLAKKENLNRKIIYNLY